MKRVCFLLTVFLYYLPSYSQDVKIDGGANLMWAEQKCKGEKDKNSLQSCLKKELKKMFKPYIKDNGVIYNFNGESLPDGDSRIQNCTISQVKVQYLGKQVICRQSGTCQLLATNVLPAHASRGNIEPTFSCIIDSAKDGCSKVSWQACGIDVSIGDDFDYTCLTNNPGKLKRGCSSLKLKVNSSGKSTSGESHGSN